MCGIAGVVGQEDRGTVDAMCRRIYHRGPDEDGRTISSKASFGMRRLSIVDLEGGSQPIENEDGSVVVVYNGEIYNHQSLRDELQSKGHSFSTDVDTEVLVHGYEEWGREIVTRLNGMFAFALLDRTRDQVILARDRLGIKPLYYSHVDEGVAFCSELTALLEHPDVSPSVSESGLKEYWAFRYLPAPSTILEDVSKLRPATVATIELDEMEIQRERYWSPDRSGNKTGSLRELLESAVEARLMADVPLGVFLSGGLDSTSVLALMDEVSSDPINTFSIGFEQDHYDESSFARRVASEFETNHHELTVDAESIRLFDETVRHMDEPLGDPAVIPTYLLADRAVSDVKVVLTGEGSDELFAGYGKYPRHDKWWNIAGGYPAPIYQIADGVRKLTPDGTRVDQYLRYLAGHRDQVSALQTIHTPRYEAFEFDEESVREAIMPYIEDAVTPNRSYPEALLHFDQQYSLPDNLLMKVDRMTMANSLEARVPFLDHRVVEFANSIDARTHFEGGTKPVLQEAVRDIVPQYVLQREKHGFRMPIDEWFARPLGAIAEAFTRENISTVPYLDQSKARSLFETHQSTSENHAHELWRIFVYIKWYTSHIEPLLE